jgi:hypothetical protein
MTECLRLTVEAPTGRGSTAPEDATEASRQRAKRAGPVQKALCNVGRPGACATGGQSASATMSRERILWRALNGATVATRYSRLYQWPRRNSGAALLLVPHLSRW